MKLLILTLIFISPFAQANQLLGIPPEVQITTTLVIDKITPTQGADRFGLVDIVILDGVHIEQSDSFGNVAKLMLGHTNSTEEAICNFAGYAAPTGNSVSGLGRYVSLGDGKAMIYNPTTKSFELNDNHSSGVGFLRVGCMNRPVPPLVGAARIAKPDPAITFELNADRIERLTLPTGNSYIRIVNPRVNFSEPILGSAKAVFGLVTKFTLDFACGYFGYPKGQHISGVTKQETTATPTWMLASVEHPTSPNGIQHDWMYQHEKEYFYSVVTCLPN